jgi:hypothetical protein
MELTVMLENGYFWTQSQFLAAFRLFERNGGCVASREMSLISVNVN